MIPLDPSLLQYREGYSVPALCWKVTLRFPPPTESSPEDIDISGRLMNEPNIVDSSDYRENLTYLNEVTMKLNNEDGYLSNEAGTGKLDTEQDVEVFIDGYLDVLSGDNFLIRKFGGWVDFNRNKTDAVRKTIDVTAYSYFGKLERISGKVLSTQRFDSNGLILPRAGLWVRDAAITGKFLKLGLHQVETRLDGSTRQAKLDDGVWTNVINGETVLQNGDNTQHLKIYQNNTMVPDITAKVIVREYGQQYPKTMYYNASLFEIVRQAFAEIGISDTYVQPYEIKTFDDRKVLSFYEIPDNKYSAVACLESDKDKRLFVGIQNKAWVRDMTTQKYTLIYDGGTNPNTEIRRLLLDDTNELLFVYLFEVSGVLSKLIKCNLSNGDIDIIFENTGPYFALTQIGNTMHYIFARQVFVFTYFHATGKGIAELDINGNLSIILTDNDLSYDGFSLIYENNDIIFFYLKIISNIPKLYKVEWDTTWSSPVYLIDFYISQTGVLSQTQGTPFYSESKIFMREYPNGDPAIYDVSGNAFFTNFNPDDYSILSPVESGDKLYVILYKQSPFTNKFGYIKNNTIYTLSENLDLEIPAWIGGDLFRACFTKNYKNFSIFNVISTTPNLLMRYSEWFNLCLRDEVDFTDNNLREVITNLASDFLGFARVAPTKQAYFVSRQEYESGSTLTFSKYNKERSGERIYSEKYDVVELKNSTTTQRYGIDYLFEPKIFTREMNYIIDELLKDLAKYFYDYYSVIRKIIKINYLPGFYNYEPLDKANLSAFGVDEGIIHRVAPKKASCEFEILMEA